MGASASCFASGPCWAYRPATALARARSLGGYFYQARNGCSWRNLPHDLPPWNVVWASFRRWRDNGTLEQVHEALRPLVRQQAGKAPQPTAGIVDSQAVRTAGKKGVAGATTRAKG